MLMIYLSTFNNIHTFTLPRRETWLFFLISNKLAQSLRDKICANLINFIKEIIFSETFLEQHRQKKTDFTRNRLLPFTSLVLYLCNFTKSSYQSELNKFFKIITGSTVARHVVSKVALCKARKKLKYEAFIELNDQATGYFYQHFNPLKWDNWPLFWHNIPFIVVIVIFLGSGVYAYIKTRPLITKVTGLLKRTKKVFVNLYYTILLKMLKSGDRAVKRAEIKLQEKR